MDQSNTKGMKMIEGSPEGIRDRQYVTIKLNAFKYEIAMNGTQPMRMNIQWRNPSRF